MCHLGEQKVPPSHPTLPSPAKPHRNLARLAERREWEMKALWTTSRGEKSGHLFSKSSYVPLNLPDSSLWCWCGGKGGGHQHESLRPEVESGLRVSAGGGADPRCCFPLLLPARSLSPAPMWPPSLTATRRAAWPARDTALLIVTINLGNSWGRTPTWFSIREGGIRAPRYLCYWRWISG